LCALSELFLPNPAHQLEYSRLCAIDADKCISLVNIIFVNSDDFGVKLHDVEFKRLGVTFFIDLDIGFRHWEQLNIDV